jgi:hypothetical protein
LVSSSIFLEIGFFTNFLFTLLFFWNYFLELRRLRINKKVKATTIIPVANPVFPLRFIIIDVFSLAEAIKLCKILDRELKNNLEV